MKFVAHEIEFVIVDGNMILQNAVLIRTEIMVIIIIIITINNSSTLRIIGSFNFYIKIWMMLFQNQIEDMKMSIVLIERYYEV